MALNADSNIFEVVTVEIGEDSEETSKEQSLVQSLTKYKTLSDLVREKRTRKDKNKNEEHQGKPTIFSFVRLW